MKIKPRSIRKQKPSKDYLNLLQAELLEAQENLGVWRDKLFKLTPTAKTGEHEFEVAKNHCLVLTTDIKKLEAEIARVEGELRNV